MFRGLTNEGAFGIVFAMKKLLIFMFFVSLTLNAYPFWIWSPKTKKWKNPTQSPLPTPQLQLERAVDEFDAQQYKVAMKELRKIIVNYPDAREAAEAQYYIGRCWEELKNPYQAFLAYQKVIASYPNSLRIQEIVEREYKIGEYFLEKEPQQWLGMSIYDFVEHPSLEIFGTIVDEVPYSPYAAPAQYKRGLLLAKLGRYQEAKDEFQKVLDNYPESEWAQAAKYQLAISSAHASGGVDYDDTSRKEAIAGFSEFLKKHPDTQLTQEAEEHFKKLREQDAQKNFDIAQFYARQHKKESAIIYYKMVIDNFPETTYAQEAQKALKSLEQ